jgi:hypothetical protein
VIENNRTVDYLKSVKKYKPITLPIDKDKRPTNNQSGINLVIYNNHAQYKHEVLSASTKKTRVIFEDEDTVVNMCVKMRSRSPLPFTEGLIHGARNGKFTNWIFQSIGVPIMSTELNPQLTKFHRFTNTEEGMKNGWDFHEIKPKWKNRFDFVWSSSFFHSYDPYKCIQQWMKCIKRGPTGQCVLLHHSPGSDAKQVERDIPFGANLDETILLINAAGRDYRNGPDGKFHVETVWNKSDGVSWERSKYKRYIVVVPTL